MSASLESQFESHADDSGVLAHSALGGVHMGARAGVVNRTHRVIRQRASVMQARRSRMRGLMAPMILCAVLLVLTAFAVWNGLYLNEAVQTDVSALTLINANDHILVVLLWFVPVSLAVLGVVLFRLHRSGADREIAR